MVRTQLSTCLPVILLATLAHSLHAQAEQKPPIQLRLKSYTIEELGAEKQKYLKLYLDVLGPKETKAVNLLGDAKKRITSVIDADGKNLVTDRTWSHLGASAPFSVDPKWPTDTKTGEAQLNRLHIRGLSIPKKLDSLKALEGKLTLVQVLTVHSHTFDDLRASLKKKTNKIQLPDNRTLTFTHVTTKKIRYEFKGHRPSAMAIWFTTADGQRLRAARGSGGGGGAGTVPVPFTFHESHYEKPLPRKIKAFVTYPNKTRQWQVPISLKGIKLVKETPEETRPKGAAPKKGDEGTAK